MIHIFHICPYFYVPKQNTFYEGEYHDEHPNIVVFWEVFESLTAEEKKKFLCKYFIIRLAVISIYVYQF